MADFHQDLPELDFRNGLPLKLQIAEFFRKRIRNGVIPPGQALPTCVELGAALGLAAHTVHRAFDLLAQEELVYRRRSLGTIVGSPGGGRPAPMPASHRKRTNAPPVSLVVRRESLAPESEREHALMFNEYLNGLMEGFNAWKCRFDVAYLQPDQPDLDLVRALVETGQTRGFIDLGLVSDAREYLIKQRVPMVNLGMDLTPRGVPSVIGDYVRGYREAWDYMKPLGHRHAAFCGFDSPNPRGFDARLRECLAARELAQPSCRLDRTARFPQEADAETIWRALVGDLGLGGTDADRPTLLFAQTDLIAIRMIQALEIHGIKVPGNVSVIGFNDTSLASFFRPALTTLHNPCYQLGLTAAQALLDLLAKRPDSTERLRILPNRLVVRETCAPPSPAD